MAGVIIIPSCRVHRSHLVKFRRGQLLKTPPLCWMKGMNQPKTEFICVYILQTMGHPLFVWLSSPPPYYFLKTAASSPAPRKHSPPQHCSPSCLAGPSSSYPLSQILLAPSLCGGRCSATFTQPCSHKSAQRWKITVCFGGFICLVFSRLPSDIEEMEMTRGSPPPPEIFLFFP